MQGPIPGEKSEVRRSLRDARRRHARGNLVLNETWSKYATRHLLTSIHAGVLGDIDARPVSQLAHGPPAIGARRALRTRLHAHQRRVDFVEDLRQQKISVILNCRYPSVRGWEQTLPSSSRSPRQDRHGKCGVSSMSLLYAACRRWSVTPRAVFPCARPPATSTTRLTYVVYGV